MATFSSLPFDSLLTSTLIHQFLNLLSLSQFPYSWWNCLSIAELYCFSVVRLFAELLFFSQPPAESPVFCRTTILLFFSSFFQPGRFSIHLRLMVPDGYSYGWCLRGRTGRLSSSGTSPSSFSILRVSAHSISRWVVRLLTWRLRGPKGRFQEVQAEAARFIMI